MFNKTVEEWKELDGFNTASEIDQQPRLWKEIPQIFDDNKEKIEKFLEEEFIDKDVDVVFTGGGTSDYVGQLVAPYLTRHAKGNFYAIPSTDLVSNPYMYLKKERPTILVNFARSGNSPESVASVNLANQLLDKVFHVFITCNPDGKLAKISDQSKNTLTLIMPEGSNDKSFAMTSSYTCMSVTAMLLFDVDNFDKNIEELSVFANTAEKLLKNAHEVLKNALDFDYERVIYLGSGPYKGIAKEAALKILELTRGKVVSLSESTMGFRHGPKSIIDDKTINFVFLPKDKYAYKYDLDIAKEMHQNEGTHKVVVYSNHFDKELEENSDQVISVDVNVENDVYLGILYLLYAQVFALHSSIKHGIKPDNPNPAGVVNRVVQGVIIYDYED